MMSDLSSVLSRFLPKFLHNAQTANVTGDNNVIEQHLHLTVQADDNITRSLLEQNLIAAAGNTPSQSYFVHENPVDDEREEIKRIVEYREIGNKGDSATALALLENLKNDDRFTSGDIAFRLNYNIGIVQQNMGELEAAAASLRTAFEYCPSNPKAKAGLALAEMNAGKYESALEGAASVLTTEGDHQALAAIVGLYSAKQLNREFRIEDYTFSDPIPPEVAVANLEYLRVVKPAEFQAALTKACEDYPDNLSVSHMWAITVLDDAKQNEAFLLGAKMPDMFKENISKAASILHRDLEGSLERRPPNKLILGMQANNAAVSLRLAGNPIASANLIDRVLHQFPEMKEYLAEVRAALYLQEQKDEEAFTLIQSFRADPRLQIMASEIEATLGRPTEALKRLNEMLLGSLDEQQRLNVLVMKAQIAINCQDREAAEQALDDLSADYSSSGELILLRSAYSRAFDFFAKNANDEEGEEVIPNVERETDRQLLASLPGLRDADFLTILRTADELLARGYFRECCDALRDKVSLSDERPALRTLCEACVRGGMGTLGNEIASGLGAEVRNSPFGFKFLANVSYLNGEPRKAVPVTRKLFEQNPKSLKGLEWYVQSLLRMNDQSRIRRVVGALGDDEMVGTLNDKREYVKLLVFCGELERARAYAYRLFCENRNDHRSWMALSASVLAIGRPRDTSDSLTISAVEEDAAFEFKKPSGETQTYIVEANKQLFALRDENIAPDHLIAKAAWGMHEGDVFPWPFGKKDETATILSVKHKALAAFHFVLRRFEEQFPDTFGFKSVNIDINRPDGLDGMKEILRERSQYVEAKVKEYEAGTLPLTITAFHLGIDPIDAFLGLKHECGVSPKVSTCFQADQEKSSIALRNARKAGIIADATACYLIRRLAIENAVQKEFGKIGITQATINVFANRLRMAEDAIDNRSVENSDGASGKEVLSSVAIQNDQIVIAQTTWEQQSARIELLRGDLDWLLNECELVPTVAKIDPHKDIIRLRNEEGGRFLDDIFACDGSERLLLSEDLFVRQWGEALFGLSSSWLQAMLFHLEEAGQITAEAAIIGTAHLISAGEWALTITTERLLRAVVMLRSGELSQGQFESLCEVLGQPGADMPTHIATTALTLQAMWSSRDLISIRERGASIMLRKIVRNQGEQAREVLSILEKAARSPFVREYIAGWRVGHFLA